MRGLPSILSLFHKEFNKFNNTGARMLDSIYHLTLKYSKCSKISNTLKLRTPKFIAKNNFHNILKNRTLTFFGKVNF